MSTKSTMTMQRRWERLRTVPGLARDSAVTVAVILIGVISGGLILSQMSFVGPWTERRILQLEFADAVAVSPGNSQNVRIAGVEVGTIVGIVPTDRDTSLVTVALEPGHRIYDNARAVLRSINPLNQMYVTLNPGGPPGGLLPDGGTIPVSQTDRPVQLAEVLQHFDERTREGLTQLLAESDNALANAPRALPATLAALDNSLDTITPVMTKLEARRDNIRRLVTALSRISAALGRDDTRLRELVDATRETLQTLADRDAELGDTLRQLPGTTDALREAMGNVSTLTEQLNPTLDNVQAASEELPDALSALRDALGPLRDTADAAREVVDKGRPIVDELLPVAGDLAESAADLRPVAACLDDVTSQLTPWMYDLGAFIYNTNSAFSVRDPAGSLLRGQTTAALSNPASQLAPGELETNTYQQGGSPIGPYPAKGSGSCRR
ncbi:MAG: MlaD family protein [Pseudonocardia sp.]